jgi:hypothetical protein
MAGNPFVADRLTTSVETLADGTKRTHVNREFLARDSSGRIRIERIMSVLPVDATEEEIRAAERSVIICDSNAGTSIHIMSTVHTAEITEDPTPAPFPDVHHVWGSWYFPNAKTKPLPANLQFEDLGYQRIEGVLAHVGRWTTLGDPQGSGGTIPIKVDERWSSEDLAAEVLEVHSDPTKGSETRIALNNLRRVEPDPSLFDIPEGYTIKKVPPGTRETRSPKIQPQANQSGSDAGAKN